MGGLSSLFKQFKVMKTKNPQIFNLRVLVEQ